MPHPKIFPPPNFYLPKELFIIRFFGDRLLDFNSSDFQLCVCVFMIDPIIPLAIASQLAAIFSRD